MKQAKRILALLLAVCMMVTIVPAAFAAAPTTMTIAQLASASDAVATTLEDAIRAGTNENGVYADVVVPSQIAVGSYTMGVEDYILMAAQAINDIQGGTASTAAISYKDITLTGNDAEGTALTTITKGQILDLARRAEKFGLTLGKLATSYNRPTDGTATYEGRLCIYSIGSIFAQALAAYAANGTLPASVTFTPSSYTTDETSAPQEPVTEPTEEPTEPSGELPVSDEYKGVIETAIFVKEHVDAYGDLPGVVGVNGKPTRMSPFSHLIAQVVINLSNGDTSSALQYRVLVIDDEDLFLNEPSNPSETAVPSTITQTEYLDLASRTIIWNNNNSAGANYMNSSVGHIHHHEAIYLYCQILAYYAENRVMPETAQIYTWAALSSDHPTITRGDATFGNDFSAFSAYLVPTNWCPSTNATIYAIAKTGMMYCDGYDGGFENPSSTYEAMFNLTEYINDSTNYDSYLNTSRGALKTWADKKGNCCDMAHLLNACARSLGVPGKYEHWSTSVGGHVWASLYCPDAPRSNINGDGYWIWADPVNNPNYLGYQNHTNYYRKAVYAELPW